MITADRAVERTNGSHYREAYARNKYPDVALGLAQVETELGNVGAARTLVQALELHRRELGEEAAALLDSLKDALSRTTSGGWCPARRLKWKVRRLRELRWHRVSI